MADPYEEAIRRLIGRGTVASSRFTRTPILVESDSGKQNTSGTYYVDKKPLIDVQLGTQPDYKSFQNVLHHEDIHALLDKSGHITPNYNAGSLIDKIKNLFLLGSLRTNYQGFQKSNRAGDVESELPAYMGAFQQGEIPGATQSTADDFITALKRIIPQDVGANYQRIIDSVKASRK